jgi:uncharacterized membrane protein
MMWLFLALYAGTGLLLAALAVPLIRRRVPPNAFYGLRIPETLADDEVWYEANARSGRDLLRAGLGIALGSGLLALVPWSEPAIYALVVTVLLLVVVIVYAIRSIRMAKELVRAKGRR